MAELHESVVLNISETPKDRELKHNTYFVDATGLVGISCGYNTFDDVSIVWFSSEGGGIWVSNEPDDVVFPVRYLTPDESIVLRNTYQ